MNEKIAVIGANSYIGRNLVYYMQKSCIDFALYDYQDKHIDCIKNYQKIDVYNEQELTLLVQEFTHIYFFVGKTGTYQGFDDYNAFIDINQRTLLSLLSVCRKKCKFPKIIFPSTRLVYKGSSHLLSEDSEKEFKSIYAIDKYACESYLKMYHEQFGINYAIFRICVPFGTMIYPVTSYGTIDTFLRQAKSGDPITIYGKGEQKRTFTHIEDLVKILFAAGLDKRCSNSVYNIGGDVASIYEAASMIADRYDVPVRKVQWPERFLLMETGDTVFNSAKLNQILDYKYSTLSKWIDEMK